MIDLIQQYIPPWVFIAFIVHFAILGTVAYLILLERKIASWTQDRIGPNRVGPLGLLQPIADGLKFILKEDYHPKHVDKVLFTVAPAIMIIVIILSIAVLPWGGIKQSTRQLTIDTATPDVMKVEAANQLFSGAKVMTVTPLRTIDPGVDVTGRFIPQQTVADVTYQWAFQITSLNIGVLFIIGVLSLAVYGVVLGGWASNNKYSFLGALRATAQMISYEIPLGLSVLAIVVIYGSLDLNTIVDKQAHYWAGVIPAWNVFTQPVAFFMFLICIHAEANRAPFDMAEAEQELVGGYHTEYSAMRFALFFLAEYAGMITTSVVCVALFFGGWHVPGWTSSGPRWAATSTRTCRRSRPASPSAWSARSSSSPRRWRSSSSSCGCAEPAAVRFDQLMQLAWRRDPDLAGGGCWSRPWCSTSSGRRTTSTRSTAGSTATLAATFFIAT
jgi:NADH-quinone oxidoreductase subunit H